MIYKNATQYANFRSDKMGKTDLHTGEFMFIGINALEPGQAHALHTHSSQEKAYVVVEGRGEVTIGEETGVVEPGDVAIANPEQPHALHNPGPDRLVTLVFMCPPVGVP